MHYVSPQNTINVIKIVMVISRKSACGQRFCHSCYRCCPQTVVPLLFQGCHSTVSSPSVSMCTHAEFN
jgi:hypothetical protein